MDFGLNGKMALVTGGSRGIGRAIALGLADEGCRVAICARGVDTLNATTEELKAKGVQAIGVPADMTKAEDIERVVRSTVDALGGVDILVNNVGGGRGRGDVDTSDADWQVALELNLLAAVRATRLCVPEMRKRGGGRVINISSIWGREAGGSLVYNANKAAVISAAKMLSLQLAKDNILVNSVAPGSISFPGGGWWRRTQEDPEGMARFVQDNIALGRFGTAEEIANVVVFLASQKASWVTGASINVDGGQSHSLI